MIPKTQQSYAQYQQPFQYNMGAPAPPNMPMGGNMQGMNTNPSNFQPGGYNPSNQMPPIRQFGGHSMQPPPIGGNLGGHPPPGDSNTGSKLGESHPNAFSNLSIGGSKLNNSGRVFQKKET